VELEQKDEFPKLVAKFQEANPTMTLQNPVFGTPDQYLPARRAAVAGGDVPEIFAPHTRALTHGTGGASADLKADLGGNFLADFFDSANQEYTLDALLDALAGRCPTICFPPWPACSRPGNTGWTSSLA
jgi:ABC-type glycerol-3-phosphate transport system substrate-binding protein